MPYIKKEYVIKDHKINYLGDTTLIKATLSGHLPVVNHLLDIGANVNETNNNGKNDITSIILYSLVLLYIKILIILITKDFLKTLYEGQSTKYLTISTVSMKELIYPPCIYLSIN